MITVSGYDTQYHRLTQTGNLTTPVRFKRSLMQQDDLGDILPSEAVILETRMGIQHKDSSSDDEERAKQDKNIFLAFIRNPGIDIRPEDKIEVIGKSDSFGIVSVQEYNQFIVLELERKFNR
jgi:hypothetical protein